VEAAGFPRPQAWRTGGSDLDRQAAAEARCTPARRAHWCEAAAGEAAGRELW